MKYKVLSTRGKYTMKRDFEEIDAWFNACIIIQFDELMLFQNWNIFSQAEDGKYWADSIIVDLEHQKVPFRLVIFPRLAVGTWPPTLLKRQRLLLSVSSGSGFIILFNYFLCLLVKRLKMPHSTKSFMNLYTLVEWIYNLPFSLHCLWSLDVFFGSFIYQFICNPLSVPNILLPCLDANS